MNNAQNTIVVLTSRLPFPLEKGDKLRIHELMRAMSSHAPIELVALHHKTPHPSEVAPLYAFCEKIHLFRVSPIERILGLIRALFSGLPFQVGYYYSPRIHRKIDALYAGRKDIRTLVHMVRMAEYVKNWNTPLIIDYMDALSKGMERRLATESGLSTRFVRMEYHRLRTYESIIFDRFKAHTIISEQDQQFIDHSEKDRIQVLPNGVDTTYFSPNPHQTEKKYDLLYCGNMSYPPNVEAVKYAAREILPELEARGMAASWIIAGASPVKAIRQLESDTVHITGWMDDIRPAFYESRIMIAPMLISIGLQNKILQAMAMGLPCVVSTLANNALKAPVGSCVLIADDAKTYADHIETLLNNPDRYREIAENAKQFCVDQYSWESAGNQMVQLLDAAAR